MHLHRHLWAVSLPQSCVRTRALPYSVACPSIKDAAVSAGDGLWACVLSTSRHAAASPSQRPGILVGAPISWCAPPLTTSSLPNAERESLISPPGSGSARPRHQMSDKSHCNTPPGGGEAAALHSSSEYILRRQVRSALRSLAAPLGWTATWCSYSWQSDLRPDQRLSQRSGNAPFNKNTGRIM